MIDENIDGSRHAVLDHFHHNPVLALGFLCGRFTAKCAAEKGRSKRAWFLCGALVFPFFPIQWMVLGILPKKIGPSLVAVAASVMQPKASAGASLMR
jgi:hypothetical protein